MPDASDVLETAQPNESRRSLLRKGAVVAAAAAAASVASAKKAHAANNGYFFIGVNNSGTVTTELSGGSSLYTTGGNSKTWFGNPVSVEGYQGTNYGIGVLGVNYNYGVGTYGFNYFGGDGVLGYNYFGGGTGVRAIGQTGLYASGYSTGLQGHGGSSTAVPLLLDETSASTVPPTSGSWTKGSFLVKNGQLWYCYVTGSGTNSKWVKMSGALIPLAAPVRAYDSRTSSGGPGPIAPGQANTRTISLSAGAPAGSSAAVISLQIINTVTSGYLSVYSGAIATFTPGFSTMQWSSPGQRLANEVNVALSPTSTIKVYGGGTTDFFIDVVGYYP